MESNLGLLSKAAAIGRMKFRKRLKHFSQPSRSLPTIRLDRAVMEKELPVTDDRVSLRWFQGVVCPSHVPNMDPGPTREERVSASELRHGGRLNAGYGMHYGGSCEAFKCLQYLHRRRKRIKGAKLSSARTRSIPRWLSFNAKTLAPTQPTSLRFLKIHCHDQSTNQ